MLHRFKVRVRALRRHLARKLRSSPDARVPFSAESTMDAICAARNTVFAVVISVFIAVAVAAVAATSALN